MLPMRVGEIGQAVSTGDLPNPCFIIWDATCLMKVYADEEVHADIQVCNYTPTQTPDNCTPFLYDNTIGSDDIMTISRTGMCLEESSVEDLLGFGINQIHVVDNSEDWFTRLQYWFDY